MFPKATEQLLVSGSPAVFTILRHLARFPRAERLPK
jgi:hypothetical protein